MLGRRTSLVVAGLLALGPLADGPAVGDPASPVQIRGFAHRHVPVGRWSYVEVRVRLADDVAELDVAGTGPGLRSRPVVLEDVDAGRVSVRLPVRLRADARVRLAVEVSSERATDAATVRVQPAH